MQLTLNELSGLPDDATVYEGVGKMYVNHPEVLDGEWS